MLTWEHGISLINGDIVYIFNEFEMYIDVTGKKLIEYINEKVSASVESRIFNATDGLKEAFHMKKLTKSSFNDKVNKIYKCNNLHHNKYLDILGKLKGVDGLDISRNILFIESTLPQIYSRDLVTKIDDKSILTLNNFNSENKKTEILENFKTTIQDKIVVMIDCVIPQGLINTLAENAVDIKYIGSQDNYEENVRLFNKEEIRDTLNKINDYNLEDYFTGLVSYIEANILNSRLEKVLIYEEPKKNFSKVIELLQSNETGLINLINHYDSRVISYKLFPYLISFVNKFPGKFPNKVNFMLKNFGCNYKYNFFQTLKEWDKIFKDCNVVCAFNHIMWNELDINDSKLIDQFFLFLQGTSSYELYSVNNKQFFNEILESTEANLRIHLEIKIIEYIIINEKFSVFDNIDNEICLYIEKVKEYCEKIVNDLHDIIDINDFPDMLQEILIQFKNKYEDITKLEWIHEDGVDFNNSTIMPFSLAFNKKLLFQRKISKYKKIRPLISNNVAFVIEERKANVINLFSNNEKKYNFDHDESSFNFLAYNANLILCDSGNIFKINKECEKTDLNIKIDTNVYNGLRIKEDFIYYFTSNQRLARVSISEFINGDAIFNEEYFEVNFSEDNYGIIDLIVVRDEVFWITSNYLWKLNIYDRKLDRRELISGAVKLFCHNDNPYILFKDSLWNINNEFNIKWFTDIHAWDSFTCYGENLILSSGRNLNFINLNSKNLQIVNYSQIESDITDIISTSNRLLIIDNNSNVYEAIIKDKGYKNVEVKIKKILEVVGDTGAIMYSHRHMAINNSDYIYIYSA